ncbi:hypothetical protein [Nocardia wallacei]|uniref:hypothetical protein n=1 Tax=Nocardia wallacei TaxID=480035 RepID=UPI0024565B13|nr:hypothetical protein [Nocardia wallacei]
MPPTSPGADQPATDPETDALSRTLGSVPPGIAELSPQRRDDLASLVEQAQRTRVEELTRAAVGALDRIPFPLRAAVRKAVGL